MLCDTELLREYLEKRSEDAFSALIERHANLIYSAALRQVGGDVHLAQDVTQAVFGALVQKGPALVRHPSLSGWLYTCVRYAARDALRLNRRRQKREEAYAVKTLSDGDSQEADWAKLVPVLDEGMHTLREEDRQALLLRFFERKKLGEIAAALGLNESAARKRVDRAIEKLRGILLRREVPLSAAALAAALEANAVGIIPAGLVERLACAVAAGGSTVSLPILTTMILTKTKIITGIALIALSGALLHEKRNTSKLREANQTLREQLTQAESAPPAPPQAGPDESLTARERSELLRLRGDASLLKAQLAEARSTKNRGKNRPETPHQRPEDQPEQQEPIRKMQEAQKLMMAFFTFSDQNAGLIPTNFVQVTEMLAQSEENPEVIRDLTNRFDIRLLGKLENAENPARTIVLREKESWPAPDGGWNRVYAFADGHTEVHKSADGDFSAWEERLGNFETPPRP